MKDSKKTKTDVRNDFKYARMLMQEADKMMKNEKNISDWSNDSDAGQLANDLQAISGAFQLWIDENKLGA